MKLYEIQIPVANNNGKEFPRKYIQAFINFIGIYAGGVSECPQINGQWYDNGKLIEEKMIPLHVACTADKIEAIAQQAKKVFDQKSIFVAELGEVSFV